MLVFPSLIAFLSLTLGSLELKSYNHMSTGSPAYGGHLIVNFNGFSETGAGNERTATVCVWIKKDHAFGDDAAEIIRFDENLSSGGISGKKGTVKLYWDSSNGYGLRASLLGSSGVIGYEFVRRKGSWIHLCGSLSYSAIDRSAQIVASIDGNELASKTGDAQSFDSTPNRIVLGDPLRIQFLGLMSEITVFSAVLSLCDRQRVAFNPSLATLPSKLAYYPLQSENDYSNQAGGTPLQLVDDSDQAPNVIYSNATVDASFVESMCMETIDPTSASPPPSPPPPPESTKPSSSPSSPPPPPLPLVTTTGVTEEYDTAEPAPTLRPNTLSATSFPGSSGATFTSFPPSSFPAQQTSMSPSPIAQQASNSSSASLSSTSIDFVDTELDWPWPALVVAVSAFAVVGPSLVLLIHIYRARKTASQSDSSLPLANISPSSTYPSDQPASSSRSRSNSRRSRSRQGSVSSSKKKLLAIPVSSSSSASSTNFDLPLNHFPSNQSYDIPPVKRKAQSEQARSVYSSVPTARSPPPSNILQHVINGSELAKEQILGAGNFGEVYLSEWHGKRVAVKVVKGADSTAQDQLLLEAEVCRALPAHPNVVRFHGVALRPALALVLEFCPDGSLQVALENQTFSGQQKLSIARGIVAGVAHLHAHRVIHRDLAARNVLLMGQVAKVSDFGMSREKTGYNQMTSTTVGPIRWMAPEAMTEQVVSTAADCFSIAVTLYELYGSAEGYAEPWQGLRNVQVAHRVIGGDHLPVPDSAPSTVSELMDACFRFDPARRPSARELVDLLAREPGKRSLTYDAAPGQKQAICKSIASPLNEDETHYIDPPRAPHSDNLYQEPPKKL